MGIATQNTGFYESVLMVNRNISISYYVPCLSQQDLREIRQNLGFRTIDEMVGHTEVLVPRFIAKGKAKSLDFARILGYETSRLHVK